MTPLKINISSAQKALKGTRSSMGKELIATFGMKHCKPLFIPSHIGWTSPHLVPWPSPWLLH
jgi:hypothetical protein